MSAPATQAFEVSQKVAAAMVDVPDRDTPALVLKVRRFAGEKSAVDSSDKTFADFSELRASLGSRALPFPTKQAYEGSRAMRTRAAAQLSNYMRHILQKPLEPRKLAVLHRFLSVYE